MTDTAGGIRRIVLTTDLGADSPDLFAQALGITLRAQGELFLVHVVEAEHPEATWRRLPTVRALLERWGRIPVGAGYADFEKLGIKVHTVERKPHEADLRTAIARRVADLKPDLVLLGPHGRSGLDLLARRRVAEPVARDVHRTTLFLPSSARPFVDPETGDLALRRVVVALAPGAGAPTVVASVEGLLRGLDAGPVQLTIVHVGTFASVPDLVLPARSDWMWKTDVRSGNVVDQILDAAVEHDADLVVMGTEGHDSFLDALMGSTMERVVRRTRVPVCAVPIRAPGV